MLHSLLAVAGGGAVGAVARYLVYVATTGVLGLEAPFATLAVNVIGSLFMGFWVEAMALAWTASKEARLFFLVGILGSFTTFSAFSLDFATLYERGRFVLCVLYATASVAVSIGALFAGLLLARKIF